jgi:hypothetical protein
MSILTEAGAARRARQRFGDITESKVEQWLGIDVADGMRYASSGLMIPVPIMGMPVLAYRGEFVPDYEPLHLLGDKVTGMTGFASLSDLISEATSGGKRQMRIFAKNAQASAAPAVGHSASLWLAAGIPAAGAAPAAPAGGTVPTKTTTGAINIEDAGGSDSNHLVSACAVSDRGCALLLYDYLFGTTTAANPGTSLINVTGTQTRYTGAAGTSEYAAGNFISNLVTVTLAATAHNITYQYFDQDNNAEEAASAITGRSGALVNTSDFTAPQWCMPLNANDTGVRDMGAITFSASPATGQVMHFVGHPLALIPCPNSNQMGYFDGVNSAFNLCKIQNGACLSLLEFFKNATNAAHYSGQLIFVGG